MLGSIIGDIIGSIYEVKEIEAIKNNKDKKRSYNERIEILNQDTSLFTVDCSYTDDSILTIAIADAILNNKEYEECLRYYGLKELNLGLDVYGRSRFGSGFVKWLQSNEQGDSFGNGSAMRISPIGYLFDTEKEIKENVIKATIPSHNNIDAIKGAEAVAMSIYMARCGRLKEEIKDYIEKKYYKLDFNLEDLQNNYRFSSKCSNSVPQALFCFFESTNFEDAIRKSISIGGDSDTIACIVGGISEAYYGIPETIKKEVSKYIPSYIKIIIKQFYLKLEFINFMNEQKLFTKEFKEFIKDRTKIIDRPVEEDWYGCFPIIKDNILVDVRLLIPKIKDEKTLLVNIHEYEHAMELFCELGKNYIDNKEERENNAKKLEKKYIKRENEYEI